MKKSIFILGAIIVAAILFYPQITISLSTGSPGGKTGSPMDNTDCTSCHTVTSTTSMLTSINSNIPSSGYVPGNTYTITASINPTSTLSGFEVTCEENTTNTKTGVLFITNPNETQLVNSGSSVTHTVGGNSMNTWSFNWAAPAAGTGGITFYGAFIEAGYPFGQNFDDYFSSTTLSASEFIPPPQTYVPDIYFEVYLEANGMGNGIPNDEYVTTANINTVTSLDVNNQNISDLTGIEDFTALTNLYCAGNLLTTLDVSNNTALTDLFCFDNQLTALDVSNNSLLADFHCGNNLLSSLDIRNGNNQNFSDISMNNNPSLTCINVDDSTYSTNNWTIAMSIIDSQHYFSNNCSGTTDIEEHTTNKELLRTIGILGRETKNTPLFYIYDDGTVEKRIVIE